MGKDYLGVFRNHWVQFAVTHFRLKNKKAIENTPTERLLEIVRNADHKTRKYWLTLHEHHVLLDRNQMRVLNTERFTAGWQYFTNGQCDHLCDAISAFLSRSYEVYDESRDIITFQRSMQELSWKTGRQVDESLHHGWNIIHVGASLKVYIF